MRAKSMVLILIALGCGLVASIAISQVMERGANSGNAALETVQLYVASTDIDVNEKLEASNVKVEDWPKSKVPEGAIFELDKVTEKFARVRFYEGEPILAAKITAEIEGAAVKIPEGFRVCSLKVQMDTSVSGLVNPGDRVDIFGYFRKSQDVPSTGTRQILRNVRVFAVNSETETETDQEGRTIVAKTVSVLVEKNQVAKLMLATELGTLRLALRHPGELSESAEDETATADTLFGSRSENADKAFEEAMLAPGSGRRPQVTAGVGQFTKFLSGLEQTKVDSSAAAPITGAAAEVPRPKWQMEILTPEGGTNFTWDNENQLPQQGGGAAAASSSRYSPRTSTHAETGVSVVPAGTPQTTPAITSDSDTATQQQPHGDEPKYQPAEQRPEKNQLMLDDD